MRGHIAYLIYVIRHKWFVYIACRACGVSFWRALMHDWSKFLPSEWFPYVHAFYAPDGSKRHIESPEFTAAWNHHQKVNKHHWQYWLITWDRGYSEPIPMPHKYAREMVADWFGAGRAITGKWEAVKWYDMNRSRIKLHEISRDYVEDLLSKVILNG